MTLEKIKEKFEEDYPEIFEVIKKHFGKGGYTAMMVFFLNFRKQEIEDACRLQREICANVYLKEKDYVVQNTTISFAILNAPSPEVN